VANAISRFRTRFDSKSYIARMGEKAEIPQNYLQGTKNRPAVQVRR
jgi:hypothetical protein